MSHRPVAITGTGAVSPLGIGTRVLFERWIAGESGIADGVGRCREYDASATFSRKETKRYDPFTQFAETAAIEALAQAGWSDGPPCDPERVGVVVGTGSGGTRTTEEGAALVTEDPRAVSGLTIPKTMCNAAAGVIAMRHGFQGPGYSVVSACASGADAICDAIRLILLGEADAVVTGGAEAQIQKLPMAAFDVMEALSPTGNSRPFDRRRDGFVMAEGSAILVLESEELALRRGANVLGWILGYGVTNDAHHMVAPHPEGRGAIAAMRRALADSGVAPDEVHYVNAHGTGTPANDETETLAIKAVFGERAYDVPVSSLKSSVGHLIGAAGALEALVTIDSLRTGIAGPTINLEEPDEQLDLDYVPLRSRPLFNGDVPQRAIALSNSFGFGGHNSVLVLAAEPEAAGAA